MNDNDDKNIKVSVIIPVWNPGDGIVRCIRSLREQTLKDIEMIFVDDRGTDEAMDIIKAAASEEPRIRILTNPENRGPGFSRNAGIEAARGEYLSFIDPDDYVEKSFLEILYNKAVSQNPSDSGIDIVKGYICYLRSDGSVARHPRQNDVIRKGLKEDKPIYLLFRYEHHSAIYKRELIMRTGVRYGLARRSQDTTFLLKACHEARTIETEDLAVYYFCERGNSTMHSRNVNSLEHLLFSFREQVDYILNALADDPWIVNYTTHLFLSNLRFYQRYENTPENTPCLKAFVKGMKEQLLRLPFCDKLTRHSFPIRVLIEKEVVLPDSPEQLPWESADPDEWLALLARWVDFLRANPSYSRDPYVVSWLYKLCVRLRLAGEEKGNARAVFKQMMKTIRPLSFRTRLKLRLHIAKGSAAKYAPKWVHKLVRIIAQR